MGKGRIRKLTGTKEINKKLKELKAQLRQVENSPALTDYYYIWKKQRISEIREEVEELRNVKEYFQTQDSIEVSIRPRPDRQ